MINEDIVNNNLGKWDEFFLEKEEGISGINYLEFQGVEKKFYFFKITTNIKQNIQINVFFSENINQKIAYIFTRTPTIFYDLSEGGQISNKLIFGNGRNYYWYNKVKRIKEECQILWNSKTDKSELYIEDYIIFSYTSNEKDKVSDIFFYEQKILLVLLLKVILKKLPIMSLIN